MEHLDWGHVIAVSAGLIIAAVPPLSGILLVLRHFSGIRRELRDDRKQRIDEIRSEAVERDREKRRLEAVEAACESIPSIRDQLRQELSDRETAKAMVAEVRGCVDTARRESTEQHSQLLSATEDRFNGLDTRLENMRKETSGKLRDVHNRIDGLYQQERSAA